MNDKNYSSIRIFMLAFCLSCFLFAMRHAGAFAYFLETKNTFVSQFNQRLEGEIASGVVKVPVKDLTDFEWGKVCVHVAYTDLKPSNKNKLIPENYRLVGSIPTIDGDGALAFEFNDFQSKEIRFIEIDKVRYSMLAPSLGCFSKGAFISVFTERISEQSYVVINIEE